MPPLIAERKSLPTKVVFFTVSFLLLLFIFVVVRINSAPDNFPIGERVVIEEGASLNDISHTLARKNIVRSAFLFRGIVIFYGKEESLRAGPHVFVEPLTAFGVARSFIQQSSLIAPARVTIPEGSRLSEFDALLHAAVPEIPEGALMEAVGGEEGVLFPDTYFIPETYTVLDVASLLTETFAEKLEPYRDAILASGFTEREVIILASILEKEGSDAESMRLISGILQKRLSIGMALQVDATFTYLLGKTSAELTLNDLEIDSPFNTYNNRGLPPSPIGSPGIKAIEAVLNPTESPYLYYLTDEDGVFYYAETFEEHKKNKERYLR